MALRVGDLGYLHVHPEGGPGGGTTEPGARLGWWGPTGTFAWSWPPPTPAPCPPSRPGTWARSRAPAMDPVEGTVATFTLSCPSGPLVF
ncbi:hypothetical protein NKH18_25755 [Streptomyces sp. M10(2022)]